MQVITFGTLKGGVGKTMLCFNLGGILANKGKKVLIIDSDLQGNLTNNMGINRTSPELKTMYDIYNVDSCQPLPQQLVVTAPNEQIPTLDLIAGSIFLHKAELKISSITGREQIFKNYIQDNKIFFDKYDYILIDTNPSMSVINQNAFVASDSILLVSDISMNALEGAQLFIALWDEARTRIRIPDNIKGFIVNDYDARNKLSQDFLEYLKTADELDDLRRISLKTIIPRTIKITESELAARPICLYDRRSKGYIALIELTEELYQKGIL